MEEHDQRALDAQTAKDKQVIEDKANAAAAEQQRREDQEAAGEAKRLADNQRQADVEKQVQGEIFAQIASAPTCEEAAAKLFTAIKGGKIPNLVIDYEAAAPAVVMAETAVPAPDPVGGAHPIGETGEGTPPVVDGQD